MLCAERVLRLQATSSGYSGELGSTVVSRVITVGQGFGVEFLLTFVVALAYFSSLCPHRAAGGVSHASVIIGMAYLAATLVGLPLTGASMNPARSLGPAFVMNSWDGHWVYWAGPILGAITAGFIHEFIFNPRRSPLSRNHSSEHGESGRGRNSGVRRREDDAEEALSSAQLTATGQSQHYNALRRTAARPGAPANLNSEDLYTTESVYGYDDYIYSGSKSLYTPAARPTSLHRSQSVCTRPLPNPDLDQPPLPVQKGLLHNNLMIYNAQQLEQKHFSQQQHLANNVDKPTSTTASLSQYAKNIRNVSSPSESEFSTASTVAPRAALKSNLIKPEPIYKSQAEPIYKTRSEHVYKTQEALSNNHNNQKHLAQQQQQYQQQAQLQQHMLLQQQQHHYTNTTSGPNVTYQNAPPPSGRNSSIAERCRSVTSDSAAGLGPKYLPGEDDDASQYGDRNLNYRHYEGNRSELPTPRSSVNAENALQPYQQYRPQGNKLY
ncbi:Major intrinsic protein [Trinorchestia longiramus]|nr:Major intrinsic protein [Trinorchestia longiramus]